MVELVSPGGVTVLARDDAVRGMLDVGFRHVEKAVRDEGHDDEGQGEELEDMSKQELVDYAKEHGIAVNQRDNKSTILAVIKGSL
jgi:hypothetical protein